MFATEGPGKPSTKPPWAGGTPPVPGREGDCPGVRDAEVPGREASRDRGREGLSTLLGMRETTLLLGDREPALGDGALGGRPDSSGRALPRLCD